jgi:hypothetical protein
VSEGDFLSRWSRRKTASKAGPELPAADAIPAPAGVQSAAPPAAPAAMPQARPPLPPVESLTPESDFTPFMQADVDPGVKRQALKQLFQDPQFNVMDGLDVYIDDYSKPDPLPEGWLQKLNVMKHLVVVEEPPESLGTKPAAAAEPVEKPVAEGPLEASAPIAPPDTSAMPNPPLEVGKSGIARE